MSSSNLSYDPLHHPSTISSLQTLTHVLETAIGPRGKLKLLENTRELTSSSQKILNRIFIKNIFSKIIVTTAKTQIGTFDDGGLLCALLILKLVCPMACDSGLSLPLVGTLYEHFAGEFLGLLEEKSSFVVDFSDLRHLKSVVLTVLSSKPGCLLSRWDRDHICSLLLRAFLDCIPSNGGSAMIPDCFRFLTVDGLPPKESRLLKGVLVQIPETNEKRFSTESARRNERPIRVALFTCSLAGDADWPVGVLETISLDLVIESTLKLLDNVVSQLVLDKIDFVFCQKVVHPRMKKRLQKTNIMILDRLGTEAAKCIQYISGGTSITSLSCEMSYGTISNINIEHLGRKSFLLLANNDTPVFSIVLAHYNEEASTELKIVCHQAMDSLLRILQNPRVCYGGGCSEVRTGLLLANKARSNLDAIKKETGCTAGQVLESLSTFLRAIANTCASIHQGKILDFVTENINGHLWKLHDGHFPTADRRCQCGSHQAALVDPSSWSFLSDLQQVFSPTSMSSDKSPVKVSPTLTINNDSFEILTSSTKDVQHVAVSSDLISASQLPKHFHSAPKFISPLNPISSKSEPDCQLSAIATSPVSAPLSNTVPDSQLSTNINSLTCDPLSNDMPASHISSTMYVPLSNTISDCKLSTIISSSSACVALSNAIPAYQLFANANISPLSISSIAPNVTSSSVSYIGPGATSSSISSIGPNVTLSSIYYIDPDVTSSISSVAANVTSTSISYIDPNVTFSNFSSIAPDVTSPRRCSQSTSDETKSILLDELSCRLNSLSLAFETASLLLRTTVCINNLPT